MNNLSWLMYWADVLPSIAVTFRVIAGIVGTLSLLGIVISLSENEDEWAKGFFKALIAAIALLVVSLTIPSKNTIYLIAASETGEEVLNTPEAAKLRGILNKWLDDQLAKTQEENQQQGG